MVPLHPLGIIRVKLHTTETIFDKSRLYFLEEHTTETIFDKARLYFLEEHTPNCLTKSVILPSILPH